MVDETAWYTMGGLRGGEAEQNGAMVGNVAILTHYPVSAPSGCGPTWNLFGLECLQNAQSALDLCAH